MISHPTGGAQPRPILCSPEDPPVRGLSHRHPLNPPRGTRTHGACLGETPRGCSPPNRHQEVSRGGQPGWAQWPPILGTRRGTASDRAGPRGAAPRPRGEKERWDCFEPLVHINKFLFEVHLRNKQCWEIRWGRSRWIESTKDL